MRLIYLVTLLSLMMGCSNEKSDGGNSDNTKNYTLSLFSYEGLDVEDLDDDYLFCDGTSGISLSLDPDSGQPSRATLLSADSDAPAMVVEFNESGQPSLITIGENYIALGNYSESSIDISCVNSNGEAFAMRNIPSSVNWTGDVAATSRVTTRYDFVAGLTNDFKTIGIGVAYGLMSVGDIYTVIVDKDYSLEGLSDKGEALLGIASNLSQAIITVLPEAENVKILADLAKDDDKDELMDGLGELSDMLDADASDIVGSFAEKVSEKVGEFLLKKLTNQEKVDAAEDGVGTGDVYIDTSNLSASSMIIYFDAAPATIDKVSFWEPGGAYKYDEDLGEYRNVGRIQYYINGNTSITGESEYNSSKYGAVVTYGTTWFQIYYEDAPDGSYGGNYMLIDCVIPSGLDTTPLLTMTVTIANDQKSYSTTAKSTNTIIPSFRYADGEFTYFQE